MSENHSTGLSDVATPTSGRLLYIEDNPVNQLVVAELVGMRPGLHLECAATGTEGVNMALALRPKLILLDMQLPDFDGYEVLARLKAHPATAGITVIALSADASPEDSQRAVGAGFEAYWTKPIDFAAFLAGIDAVFAVAKS